ncbi:MAG: response regulator [Candidatus Bathyarchaeota archaeon]|nr:response regulator [Candidatus Bathyarchaeota archaeon]
MGKKPRILIIDDDENIRKTLAAILEDEGYVVDHAENCQQALEKTAKSFYNVLLIDMRLPDMEGIDLIPKIRDTVPKMRKVIVTGYPTLQNAIEAVNRGADAYIVKPFDVDKVLAVIKEQLRKQQEELRFSQERVTEFIAARLKELEATKA